MFNKLNCFFQKKKSTIKAMTIPAGVTAALASTTSMPLAAINADANSIIQAILNGLFTMVQWIGVLLLAWGIISLVLAVRNEDADSKSRAIMSIIVAIGAICMGTVFNAVLAAIGFTVTPV